MLLRLFRWLLVLTLTLSLGAHWALLQSVAWLGMVVTYSRDASITEALSKTFDGQHPCSLCKAIAKGKRTEKKSDVQFVVKKLEFAHASAAFHFAAPILLHGACNRWVCFKAVCHPPLIPPPRPQAV